MEQVDNIVWRGGEPESFTQYKDNGFKTVINLETGWWSALLATEDAELISCHQFGIDYYDFCLSQFTPPTDSQISTILNILQNGKPPFYVHCRHGHERTGFIIAVYRMKLCGWSFDAAYQEWIEKGCNWPWYLMWKNELKKYS